MKGNESMTAQEAARLMDWLLKNGHTPEEAIQCVNYIEKPMSDEEFQRDVANRMNWLVYAAHAMN